ncbi:hypothetical protein J2T05_000064 [Cupriavidus necator]|nr:hypothetical protein [Cupriavidus necator]
MGIADLNMTSLSFNRIAEAGVAWIHVDNSVKAAPGIDETANPVEQLAKPVRRTGQPRPCPRPASPLAVRPVDFEREEAKCLACCARAMSDMVIEADIEPDPDAQCLPLMDFTAEVVRIEAMTPTGSVPAH